MLLVLFLVGGISLNTAAGHQRSPPPWAKNWSCRAEKRPAQGPRALLTHNPAASVCVHVAVHLQGPAGVAMQVDGVQATGDVAVLLNLTAVRRVWETGTSWQPSRGTALRGGLGRRAAGWPPILS